MIWKKKKKKVNVTTQRGMMAPFSSTLMGPKPAKRRRVKKDGY